MTQFFYEAFGQIIASDVRLHELPPSTAFSEPTLHIHNEPFPQLSDRRWKWARSRSLEPGGHPTFTIDRFANDGGFHIRFGSEMAFAINGGGRHIWSTSLVGEEAGIAAAYLNGFVISLALYLQGYTCLHASSIVVDGQAILFVGEAGYGKSSMAATLVLQGFPLLSDDLIVLEPANHGGAFTISATVPSIRLRPDMATLLMGDEKALAPDPAQRDKRCLMVDPSGSCFSRAAKPLAAIYLLRSRPGAANGRPWVQLAKREALFDLSRYGYLPNLMDRGMQRAEFETLGDVVDVVPVRPLPPVKNVAEIPALCRAVVANVRENSAPRYSPPPSR